MAKVLGFQINIQGTEQSIQTAEQLKRAIAELQKELKKAGDVETIVKLEEQLVDLKARQQEVNATIRDEIKLRRTELNAVDDVTGTYDKLSKTLNEQRKRYKDLAAAGKESSAEAIKLRGDINELDKQLKKIDANVGQFQRNVGGYTQALEQFFPRISSGIGQVTNGFKAAQGAAGGFNKALGFIGLAVTVITGIIDALQSAKETAREFNDIQGRLAQTTDLSKLAIQEQSATIVALSRTYEASTNEILNAANTLSKEFGISLGNSLELIEAGFRKGANAQGDFIDQLREYPAQFAAAGGSAEEFLSVLIRAQNEGIYSDKGIDAIKEFGLRIREQTTATRDALTNAFGPKFTQELFDGINKGSITTVQALKRVSKGLQDTSLTAAQVQTVIADTFGGAGEDAGLRYLQLLGDIEGKTDDVVASTNEYESQQLRIFRSNQQLAQSQSLLADSIGASNKDFEILGNTLKTLGNNILAGVIWYFRNLKVGVSSFFDAISAFVETEGGIVKKIQAAQKSFQESARKQQEEYAANVKESREKEKRESGEYAAALLNTENELNKRLERLRAQRAGVVIGSADYKKLTKEIEEIEKRLAVAGGKAGGKAGGDTGKAFIDGSIAAFQKEANRLKAAIEEAVAGSEIQAALIAAYDKQQKLLEEAIAKRNKLEFEGQRQATLANLNNIEQLGERTLSLSVQQSDKAIAKQKANVLKGVTDITNSSRKKLKEIQDKDKEELEKQKQQIQQFIAQGVDATFGLINALAAAANQKRNEIFQREIESTEARIADIEQRANKATGVRKKLLEQQAAAEKKTLEEQTKRAEAEQKKQRKNEKRNAIIQSIIQGALAVQRALSFPPGPPVTIPSAVATGVFAALQTATIAAQPLATGGVVGISGRRVNDRQNIPTRSNGDNVLATVRRGEVVLNSRQQAALGGATTFRSIGVPGFANGGMISPPMSAPNIPQSLTKDNTNMIAALDRKTDAINARLDRLRAYVVTEDIERDMADGRAVKVKAEL
jgi:hypothetical protein